MAAPVLLLSKAFNNVVVDWSLVKALDVYDYDENKVDSESAIAANQLANLCFELGKKEYCNVKYATDGTPTTIYKAKDALSKLEYKNLDIRLGFAKGDREVAYNQLREGELVFMKAATSNSAHAWVVDGYYHKMEHMIEYYETEMGGDRMIVNESPIVTSHLHINWGWDGNGNGYFNEGVFKPSNPISLDSPTLTSNVTVNYNDASRLQMLTGISPLN